MDPHVSDSDLDQLRSAELTPDDAATVEEHLASCEECRRRGEEKTEGYEPSVPDSQAPRNLLVPDRVGPYQVLEEIGEGGMGVVYLAVQTEPIRRRVALKIIKPGMDTKAVIARFEAERQALALMDHPNVAVVFDAGATEQGRPYFAMELIEGVPITDYCDRHLLTTSQRLELFIPVCRAVQHAHQKGIIHRDIKPSNILVTVQEDRAVPKVIDFGVAKATTQSLTERTLFTAHGQLIGTPEYMSPEQAEMTSLNVDTRTDVYSLGVVLYELLAGALPFEPTRLRKKAFEEIQRIIREEEPLRPSTRLSSHGVDPAAIARCRKTDFHALTRQLRGDLDWITLKSIQKDRTRRYETAGELGADIARYLHHQPVLAGPPSAAYAVKKFIRRHRAFVSGAAVVLFVLIAGITASTILAVREARARGEATQARDDLQVVVDFQRSMLGDIDAQQMGRSLFMHLRERVRTAMLEEGDSPELREAALESLDEGLQFVNGTDLALDILDEHVLARALAVIERDFADQPLVRAALAETIATTYGDMGLPAAALPLQESVVRIRRQELGDEDPATLTSIANLAALRKGTGDFATSLAGFQEALDASRRVLGNEDPRTLRLIYETGNALRMVGQYEQGLAYCREALEGQRLMQGNHHEDTLSTLNLMGVMLSEWGRSEEAEPYYLEALSGRRDLLGDEHPDTITSIGNMGWLFRRLGQHDRAASHFREALDLRRRVLGNEHPSTLRAVDSLGGCLVAMGELERAEVLYREALDGRRQMLGDTHQDTLRSVFAMGSLYRASGDLDRALEYYREALEGRRLALGEDHPQTVSSIRSLAQVHHELGQFEEAAALGAEAVSRARRSGVEAAARFTGTYLLGYGRTLIQLARYEEADRALQEGYEILTSTSSDDGGDVRAAESLVELYTAWQADEPDGGFGDRVAEWRRKLAALEAERTQRDR